MKKENKNNQSIVYCAINSLNKKKYIGVTCRTLERRIYEHKRSMSSNIKYTFCNALRKYGFESFNFYTLSKWDNYNDALEEEIRVISLVKPEYNMAGGGQGIRMPKTEAWKKLMSKKFKGRIIPQEQLENMRKSRKPDQGFKKIICLNDGCVYPSVKDAAKKYNTSRNNISSVLNGNGQSANGLFFVFYSDDILIDESRKNLLEELKNKKKFSNFKSSAVLSKPVICLNDNLIYPSALKASEFYGISDGTIRNSCVGRHHSKSGFHFKYLENEDDNIVRENFVQISYKRKKVLCVEDNKVFDSICHAAKFYGASDGNIGMVLKGKRSHAKGKTFKYVENV